MRRAAVLAGLAPLALAALALTGCVATQRDVLDLEAQSDELKKEVVDLKKTISSLQANQADLSVQMKQLHEDISSYTEATKDNQDRMTRLSSKLDDMSAAIEAKVASIGSTLTAQQQKSLEEQKAATAAAAAAASRENPTDLFNTADVRLGVKDYGLAAQGFESYVTKYPKGALIDVATYKLGQAYFGLRQWEKAGRQFGTVLDKYPKSEMTASARLMYAMCLVRMKKSLDEARQYLESVTNDFPKSPEAKAAAAELKKLRKS